MSAMLNYTKAQRDTARETCGEILAALENMVDELSPEAWDALPAPTQAEVMAAIGKGKGPSADPFVAKAMKKMTDKKKGHSA